MHSLHTKHHKKFFLFHAFVPLFVCFYESALDSLEISWKPALWYVSRFIWRSASSDAGYWISGVIDDADDFVRIAEILRLFYTTGDVQSCDIGL